MLRSSLTWVVTGEGFLFRLRDVSNPASAWGEAALEPSDSLVQLLDQLVSEGRGYYVDGAVLVPHEMAAGLDEDERTILTLPEPFPFDVEIRSSGTLNAPDFRYLLLFMNGRDQPFVNPVRQGAHLRVGGDQEYLLTGDLFRLVDSVEKFNARVGSIPRAAPERLLRFAEIAGLARNVGATLDHYLNSQRVVAPGRISVRLRRLPGGSLEVDPIFYAEVPGEGEESQPQTLLSREEETDFLRKFDALRDVRNVYPLRNNVKLVLGERQKEALRQVKACRRLAGEEKEAFLRTPQEFLDPELIDLDHFSDRVVEIGEYRPRFFPFLSAVGESWFPEGGVIVETAEGSKQVYVSPQEIPMLKERIQEALSSGKTEIRWKGELLPVSDGLIEAAEELNTAYRAVSDASVESLARAKAAARKILIIKDNFEELLYKCGEKPRPGEDGRLPKCLKPETRLLEHQYEGIKWLQKAWFYGRRGALLADDMGLGKTLQALVFMAWVRELMDERLMEARPMLVVAPQVLLTNWAEEYGRYLEPIFGPPMILHGDELRRLRKAGEENEGEEVGAAVRQKRLDVAYLKKVGLVITTYETVRDYQVSLGLVDWGVMVLDEAQKIKNPTALVTTAAKAMKYEFGICLTGTPVENSWIDLWSILDFAIPGHLEPLTEFARKYHYPLRKHGTDVEALGRELKEKVAPYFLRRMKKDQLKGLPEKKVMYHPVSMPEYQLRRYLDCVTQARRTLPDPQGGGKGKHILRAIQLLYEISLHPDLPCLSESCLASKPVGEFISTSAKLLKTFEILDDVRRVGEKAVIFLRSRKLQRLLQRAIYDRYGLKTAIVNGETLGEVRKRLVDGFQAKPGFNVIIMSPDAAGVGLNVVAANHVIHLSRPWNPAKEDQATDRVYRIGQEKTVFVHMPLAVHPLFEGGSFDEKLDRLLERKRQLSATVLLPPQVEEWEKLSFAEDVLACSAGEPEEGSFLTPKDVDEMAPSIFEMLVAALFKQMGYVAEPTPTHDRGADVVAVAGEGHERGILIQCKHVRQPVEPVGPAAVREIVAARGIYEPIYGCAFNLAVVTNAHGFTKSAVELADANSVTLVAREKLTEWLRDYPVDHAEVLLC